MPLSRAATFVSLCLALGVTASAAEPDQAWLEGELGSIVELYKDLHQSPELSFQEEQTASKVAAQLAGAGLEVTTGVGGHGVVGLLRNGEGKTLMIRTDLDALPVAELTGLPYASTVEVEDETGAEVGVMHACGHDIHMANFIGVARYLAEHRDEWSGTVMFVGQPAEERGAGAKAMLEDGLFDRFPKPDYAVALHVAADLPAGKVGYGAGYAMANVDSVDITVIGRGGHGAYPETTIDPIVIAAKLVLDLQTVVSREIRAIDPAVVTVGSIHGGTKHNIIGAECHLQLTVRSYSQEVREKLWAAIRRKANAAAQSAGAPEPEVTISEGTPSLYNDPQLTARVAKSLSAAVGPANVVEVEPVMGGEDFSRYGLAGTPICMFKLGAVGEQRFEEFTTRGEPMPSLHSPQFYPDPERTLEVGLRTTTSVALDLLSPSQN